LSTAVVPRVGLKEGERVLLYRKRCLRARLGAFIALFILASLGLLLSSVPFWPVQLMGLAVAILGFAAIVYAILETRAYAYYVTNVRVIEERALLGQSVKETTLDKVTDIVTSQGAFGRLLNYGTVHVHTAGTGFLGIEFKDVSDPLVVRGTLINAKDAYIKGAK
jgi:uncharacterized membrane protein YdbT with pleckstrin-like domain